MQTFIPTHLLVRHPQVYRLTLALIIPATAAILQQWFWPDIPPSAWLLLYPAVFFSAWFGGFWAGLMSTAAATLLGLHFFVHPEEPWPVQNLERGYSIAVFAAMGLLISITHEKLKRSQRAWAANANQLKTHQDLLTLALTSANAGLWEWDVQTSQLFWSDNLWSIYGLEPSSPPSYENWLGSVHPDDQAAVIASLNHYVTAGLEINLEWRVANLPGNQERWLMSRGQAVFDEQGKAVLYRGIVLDITQRKQQEQLIEEHQQRLDFALSTLEAGAWELNLQDRTVHRTLLHDLIFGYQKRLPGWTFEQFLDHVLPEDRDAVQQRFNTAIQTRTDWDFECRIRRTDGEIRWIYAKGRLKLDQMERPVSIAGIVQDISGHKQAEESLTRTHTLLNALMTQAPMGFAYLDLELRYLLINDSLAALNGLTAAAHIGQRVHDIVPTLAAAAEDVAKLILATGEPVKDYEFSGEIPTAPGVTGYWNESWYPLYDDTGQITGFGAMVENITERKRAEEALREADRRKDEFLAMLAHELRNPLAPISSAVQIMKRPSLDETRLAWCRNVIGRQVEHLVQLVDDLLDVSRISRGKIELKKEILEVAAIVQRAIETTQPLIEARHHAFTVHQPQNPLYVEGDLVRLSQVVANLLNNAAKYTDEGGCIGLTVEQSGNDILIRVRDNGRGIEPSALPSLFQLFYQVDHTIDRAEGGLGIGLALVKSLVTMHGGEVRAHSEGRGRGSEFVIRLPGLRRAPTVPIVDTTKPEFIEDPLRILVVDDNRDAAQSLSMLLSGEGHTVGLAYDGPSGLETALAERPQIVLLDIGLPGMDGYAVARALRQQPGLDRMQLIALSGYGRKEDREQARAAGFNGYLTKPVNFDELHYALAQSPFDH
jgi:PAS domain S-box-containing protein